MGNPLHAPYLVRALWFVVPAKKTFAIRYEHVWS
jgi:hypothetical protein